MPKKWRAPEDHSKVKPSEGFGDYTGPTPPAGVYRVEIKLARLVQENKSGNPMLKVLFEIVDAKGPKSKYKGAGIWWNGNLTAQGAPFVNRWAEAFGMQYTALWRGGVVLDDDNDDQPSILKIGGKKPVGLTANAKCRRREHPKGSGEFSLNANDFFGVSESDDEDDGEEDDDLDDESSDDDFDDDSDSSEDDDDEYEDDEEEPEPVKKAPAKKAPAKKAAPAKRKPAPVEDDDEYDDDDEDAY